MSDRLTFDEIESRMDSQDSRDPDKVFDALKIVNTGKLWQDSDEWNIIAIINPRTGRVLRLGGDMINIRDKRDRESRLDMTHPNFSIEARTDGSFIYYGAKFRVPSNGSNTLEIELVG